MNRRILVADDDKDVRYLMRIMLGQAGYEVIEADTAERALALACSDPPALCVLDVMMPEMNGLEVCRRLKQNEQTRSLPIIVLTAFVSETNRTQALQAGAAEFITKPFSARGLIERVQQILD